MVELKTKPNEQDVEQFLNATPDDRKREDSFALLSLMKDATGSEPVMWGDNIVGFGSYHYCYHSGREGNWFLVGFSPRKQNLTLYIMSGFEQYDELLGRLGKHSTGKSCLHIKRLADVDLATLRELVKQSAEHVARTTA